MVMNIENPFDIIKAVDYTADQILDFWVDYADGNWFKTNILQSTTVPLFLLGSKGSGKTHIMRYFSFELQKLRYATNSSVFQEDGFLGIYLRCTGFVSSRFSGLQKNDEYWISVFQYYWDIYLSQLTLMNLRDLLSMKLVDSDEETSFCQELSNIFNDYNGGFSFEAIIHYLREKQNAIDLQIADAQYGIEDNKKTITIFDNILTIKIPKLAKKHIRFFYDVDIMYLVDEFENIEENQQRVVQTMLREKDPSYSFVIGTRLYGVKTFKVIGSEEENQEGSEYKTIKLDTLLRKDAKKYANFITKIYTSRLPHYMKSSDLLWPYQRKSQFIQEGLPEDRKWNCLKILQTKLKNDAGFNIKESEDLCALLKNNDKLIERANVFLIYSKWKKNQKVNDIKDVLMKYAYEISKDKKDVVCERGKKLKYFADDLLDAIRLEARDKRYYYTFNDLIKLSAGTPRVFLNIMKYTYSWYVYLYEKDPLISSFDGEALRLGIKDTMKWFDQECATSLLNYKEYYNKIERLGQYLSALRFSDLPPQCSIGIFSITHLSALPDLSVILKEMVNHSLLIENESRVLKNQKKETMVYQINPAIISRWNLSLDKRGNVELDDEGVNYIFGSKTDAEFKQYLKRVLKKYNVPFAYKEQQSNIKQNENMTQQEIPFPSHD